MIFDVDDVYEIEEGYETKLEKKDKEIKQLKNQLQQKENIIKEAREYIEKYLIQNDISNQDYQDRYKELLEILGGGEINDK